ncbi:MerR family transcriptional regulator [Mycolicibacterium arseniciresistens]|uniref:MerR family transcriptional regulator n=1 Tax=Mycolicibacterium arseniciresistens TaxID=3062257 RepID=A0ABT8UBG6_9MYCO|nr:MerR family transcriptional regulator [Mycolicibacterium arseniciresistens]MDO3635138.1 MerR family transcriptional regulator [Mycolicibacterium arseniciresistens]
MPGIPRPRDPRLSHLRRCGRPRGLVAPWPATRLSGLDLLVAATSSVGVGHREGLRSVSWSIQQAARVSGVTARTLRYYDEIGLLRPARVGSNGYRYYEREQLLRLQQILLLRDLGLNLTTIGQVVDAQHDPIEALRRHHRRLLDERGRLDRLAATVAATIEHLEEGTDMPAEHMFEGFEMSPEHLDDLEARRIESTGRTEQPEITEIKRNTAEWAKRDWDQFNAEGHALARRMVALLRAGVAADDAETFAVLDDDLALQRKLWSPDKASYVEQAEGLRQPSELRSYYNAQDPRLAEYLREAMLAYAGSRMQ